MPSSMRSVTLWHVAIASSSEASAPSRSRIARPAGRNPRTGEQVDVGEKSVPQFKAGKEIRERLNR